MLQQRIYGVVKTVDDLAGAQLNLTKVTKVRLGLRTAEHPVSPGTETYEIDK